MEAPPEDFGPSSAFTNTGATNGRATLTLNAKMTRDKISHMDLASLSEQFGSLGARAQRGEVRMISTESRFGLDTLAGGDEDETY